MKESEKIQLEIDRLSGDDDVNDWEIHRLNVKRIRAENMEKFESKWLATFQKQFQVDIRENESFTIHTRSHGKIDFYPKGNKILFRRNNKWRTRGLNWLVRNLLDMK